MKVFIALIDS